jgi:hypothetical protein
VKAPMLSRNSLRSELQRTRLSLDLLFDRRVVVFASVYLMTLLYGVTQAVTEPKTFFYGEVFLVPLLLIGIPVLSDCIALERRAGSLDLALSSPGARMYFVRRIGALVGAAMIQGWLLLLIEWGFVTSRRYPVWMYLVQVVVVSALFGSIILFWAVRLKSPGAVVFATCLTILALKPWFFSNPVGFDVNQVTGRFAFPFEVYATFLKNNLVLGSATVVFTLYAHRRLARPESLLS